MSGAQDNGAGDITAAPTAAPTAEPVADIAARKPGPGLGAGLGRPVFLERASYRRRRIVDAVRLLPLIGALLWAVPLLWTQGVTMVSAALLYVFGIWVGLVVAAALFARGVADIPVDGETGRSEREGR